jgi:7,8-dihydroneopterin aldolase/epimerase/oxygenase
VESPAGANDQIHIEQLEIFARVGVTENERSAPQRLTLTITAWPSRAFDTLADDIANTADYSAMAAAAREFAAARCDRLIETLAAGLAEALLRNFAIRMVRIELRKFVLPGAQYVAVIVRRMAPKA